MTEPNPEPGPTVPVDLESEPAIDPDDQPQLPSYPVRSPGSTGVWRTILDAGEPVGVIWTDFEETAGMSWAREIPVMTEVTRVLGTERGFDTAPGDAYNLVTQIEGLELGPEQSGSLDDVAALEEQIYDAVNGI